MKAVNVAILSEDAAERAAMKRTLASVAFRVELFSAAEEFLASAWMREAECLIVDSHLNDSADVELTSLFAERGVNVPVVVTTPSRREAIRRQRTDQCSVVYVHKPFSAAQLIEAIIDALGLPAESGGTGQRYFFGFEPHGVMDSEGHVFRDEEAACREAQTVAEELARNRNPDPLERIVVTDEKGLVISEEYLIDQADGILFHRLRRSASTEGRLVS